MEFALSQILGGLSYGALLFTIASGFSLIYGLMNITNMAHVVFYMMGAYFGWWTYDVTGNYILALLAAFCGTGLMGFLAYKLCLAPLHGKGLAQVLCCLGMLFFFDDLLLMLFGGYPKMITPPAPFDTSVTLWGDFVFPKWRLLLIVVSVLLIVGLDLIVNRTKLGALIRSGVDDSETTQAMGVNIKKLFVIVYAGGTALAGIGGTLGASVLGMEPRMCFTLLPYALAIVIIGGRGNLRGSFYSSMLIGIIDSFGKALLPQLSYFIIFLPMALVLVLKPEGLFTKKVRR